MTDREMAERLLFLAEHLFQMIDPQTWRDTGGDDGQGHYEGDYRAASTREELERFRELLHPTPDHTQGNLAANLSASMESALEEEVAQAGLRLYEKVEGRVTLKPGGSTDECLSCGIHRMNAGVVPETCGDGFLGPDCFLEEKP